MDQILFTTSRAKIQFHAKIGAHIHIFAQEIILLFHKLHNWLFDNKNANKTHEKLKILVFFILIKSLDCKEVL